MRNLVSLLLFTALFLLIGSLWVIRVIGIDAYLSALAQSPFAGVELSAWPFYLGSTLACVLNYLRLQKYLGKGVGYFIHLGWQSGVLAILFSFYIMNILNGVMFQSLSNFFIGLFAPFIELFFSLALGLGFVTIVTGVVSGFLLWLFVVKLAR